MGIIYTPLFVKDEKWVNWVIFSLVSTIILSKVSTHSNLSTLPVTNFKIIGEVSCTVKLSLHLIFPLKGQDWYVSHRRNYAPQSFLFFLVFLK